MTATHHIDQYNQLLVDIAKCNYLSDFRALDKPINDFIRTLYNKFLQGELTNLIIDQYMKSIEERIEELQQSFLN